MAMRQQTRQKLYIALGLTAVLALLMLFAFSGGNLTILKSLLTKDLSNDELRDLLQDFGFYKTVDPQKEGRCVPKV